MSAKKNLIKQNHYDPHHAQIPTPCSEDVLNNGGSGACTVSKSDPKDDVSGLDTPQKSAQGTDSIAVQGQAPGTDNLDLQRAVLPQYHSVKARLQTFDDWPQYGALRPRDLVLAGFLYTGKGDSVQCFYCGVMLKNWGCQDSPWETHALFRFSCDYVRAVKGEQFVMDTLSNRAREAVVGGDNPNAVNFSTEVHVPASSDSVDNRSRQPTTSSMANNDMSSTAATLTPGNSFENESIRRVGSPANGSNGEGSPAAPKGVVAASDVESSAATKSHCRSGDEFTKPKPQVLLGLLANKSEPVIFPVYTFTSMTEGLPGQTLADSPTCGASIVSSKTALHPQENPLSSAPLMTDSTGSTVSREFPASARQSGSSTSSVPAPNNDDVEARFRRLQQTNQRLRQHSTCRLCGLRPVDTIFLPCGHLVTCDSCASTIRSCCLCREHIRATAHVYLE